MALLGVVMKTVAFLGVIGLCAYLYTHQPARDPAPPSAPPAAAAVPVSPSTAAAPPRARGQLVLVHGKVQQKIPGGGLLLECYLNLGVRGGGFALDTPFRSPIDGVSEIGETIWLVGHPSEQSVVDNDQLGGVAEILGPVSFTTVLGANRTVRKMRWVDPTTVANLQPGAAKPKAWIDRAGGTALDQPAGNAGRHGR